MVQFSWSVGAPTSWVPWSMRLMGVPGVARLIAAMPATERSARVTFRRIGHGPSLDAGRITDEDIATYLALLRYTKTMREDARIARVLGAFVS
jgi:hypothetical protein